LTFASNKLTELNAQQVPFRAAPGHGDHFPFFVNYVERGPQFVSSHFGAQMAENVFALASSDGTWHGPFESQYGAHLVLLARKTEGRYPKLAEVVTGVHDAVERAAIKAQKDKAIQRIVDTYEVRRSYIHQLVSMVQ
jgi:hypothetical protein